MMMEQVPVIVGPTGVGKTRLSLLIAEKLPVEIISADSRQIYRYMDIGTAKVEKSIREQIPHHFIDICNPDEYYSAGMFGQQARKVALEILERQRLPLIVGGSGFYIRALLDGIFELQIKDEQVRQQLEARLEKEGLPELYRQLQQVDPDYAKKISANDRQRILRSLEVYQITGKPFSYWHTLPPKPAPFKPLIYGLTAERSILYDRINRRVEQMMAQGLVEEVQRILDMGYSPELNALNTVGYKEVVAFLQNRLDRSTMIEKIKQNSRRYAKRQLTWFRADQRIQWFDVNEEADLERIAALILKEFNPAR